MIDLAGLGPVAIGFGTLAGLVFVIRLALSYQRNVTEALIQENERLRRLLAAKEGGGDMWMRGEEMGP